MLNPISKLSDPSLWIAIAVMYVVLRMAEQRDTFGFAKIIGTGA